MTLSVDLDDRYFDLREDGFDVGIRVAKDLPDSSLVARKLTSTPDILVASPRYVASHGVPKSPTALCEHQCITLARQNTKWIFASPNGPIDVRIDHATTVSNDLTLILLACLGGGIIRSPRLLVDSELRRGRLIQILAEFKFKRDYGIFAIYPGNSPLASVRVFVELVATWLPKLGELDRWNPLLLPLEGESGRGERI